MVLQSETLASCPVDWSIPTHILARLLLCRILPVHFAHSARHSLLHVCALPSRNPLQSRQLSFSPSVGTGLAHAASRRPGHPVGTLAREGSGVRHRWHVVLTRAEQTGGVTMASYALWSVSPEGMAAQEQLERLERQVADLQRNGFIPLRKDRRRGRQDTKVRPDRDMRPWVAWYRRGADRRWRVYHRCWMTGKVGQPIKVGRGRIGELRAMVTCCIMQASGLQIEREIQALIH